MAQVENYQAKSVTANGAREWVKNNIKPQERSEHE
nr:MAG TPA: hypothetical protein [Caudoviricetes sp.]